MTIDWDILKKSFNGTLNVRERQALEQWLGESARHRHFYEAARAHYALPLEKIALDDTELDAAWDRFSAHARQRNGRRRTVWMAAASLAATVALCVWTLRPSMDSPGQEQAPLITAGTTQAILSVGSGEKILLNSGEQDGEWKKFVSSERPGEQPAPESAPSTPETIRIEIPRGGEYRLLLPDSTMVWLNAETVIEYPSKFIAGTRTVTLEGEAFFDVAHDGVRPFMILTPDRLEITVLGTRFNVSSYLDVNLAQITLVEGSLCVSDGARRLTLHPCQQAVFDRAERTLSLQEAEDTSSYCAWTNGMFDFKLQPLEVILDAVSKWYAIEIVYDPAKVQRFNAITLQCDRRSDFTHVMEILHKITGLNYRTEDKRVYLSF